VKLTTPKELTITAAISTTIVMATASLVMDFWLD
jgi:hypothetical protein